MNPNIRGETAKIYEFPQKLRMNSAGRRFDEKTEAALRHLPCVEFGSGWYHEAAVQAVDRTQKP